MNFAERVRIVLVEPEFPGNIGSAARAMQTMGLSRLHLVNPQCDPQADEAHWLATSAGEILRQASVVRTLSEALADTVFSVGTTRRDRRQGYPVLTPEQGATWALDRAASGPVAFVFGRESKGLNNAELALCSVQSTIPTQSERHSLNLAQAVMLYCYAVYQASLEPAARESEWNLATHSELEGFYTKLDQALTGNGFKPATTMENYIARFRRVLGRVPLESRDIHLLHKLISRIPHAPPGSPGAVDSSDTGAGRGRGKTGETPPPPG